jgi:hypothetical protein
MPLTAQTALGNVGGAQLLRAWATRPKRVEVTSDCNAEAVLAVVA